MAGNNLFSGLPEKPKEDVSKVPEELKGKSIDEIYTLLSEEHEKEMEQAKAEMSKPMEQQKPSSPPSGPQYQYQAPQYSPPPQEEDEVDLVSDPDRFMEKQFKKRLDPLVHNTYNSMKEMNKQSFIGRVGAENWDKYGQEVEIFVNALSPQIQINPQAYQQAYQYVLSTHLDEIVDSQSTQKASEKLQKTLIRLGIDPSSLNDEDDDTQAQPERKSLFMRNPARATTQPVKSAKTDTKPKRKLSAEEKKVADAFDMTDEEYAEYAALNTDLISSLGGQ